MLFKVRSINAFSRFEERPQSTDDGRNNGKLRISPMLLFKLAPRGGGVGGGLGGLEKGAHPCMNEAE